MELKLNVLLKWLVNRLEAVDNKLYCYKDDAQEYLLQSMEDVLTDVLNVLNSLIKFVDFADSVVFINKKWKEEIEKETK